MRIVRCQWVWGVLCLCLCLCACHKGRYPRVLLQADSLAEVMPDSALRLLEGWADSVSAAPERVQMYYRLLTVKAADKAYIPHTSDSIIRPVLDYYEQEGDRRLLPEAYYYAGRVYRDLGDAPQALDYFERAAELLRGSYYYKLQKVLYSQMGDLFLFQDVYDEALKAYRSSLDFQEKAGDEKGRILILCRIGAAFMGCDDADSALYYYRQAYHHAEGLGDRKWKNRALSSICDLYTQLGKYDDARKVLQELQSSDAKDESFVYSDAADFFFQVNEEDSAIYYYKKLLGVDNIYAKQGACWGLGKLAQERGDSRAALVYLQGYISWTDSIVKRTNTDAVRKMQALYNYSLREKETLRFMQANEQLRKSLVGGCFFLLLLMGLLLYVRMRSRQKEMQLKIQQERMARLEENSRVQREQLLEDNRRKIEYLERRLQESRDENDDMHRLLLLQKKQVIRANEWMGKELQEQELAEKILRQSDIYGKFHRSVAEGCAVTAEDWKQLQEVVDTCYRNFTFRLFQVYPLSEVELKICLLLKVGISNHGIARLIGRSESGIVSARKSLYEKFHGKKGTPKQWDDFIRSM